MDDGIFQPSILWNGEIEQQTVTSPIRYPWAEFDIRRVDQVERTNPGNPARKRDTAF